MSLGRVLITGSNSGLGQHLTKKFLDCGHEVLRHNGRKDFNLTEDSQVKNLAEKALEFDVNILINNAAIVCPGTELGEYSTKLISDMINVNLRAPILLAYYLLPRLTDMININSMVGLETKKQRTLYSATKWGLRGFSNSLREEANHVKILDVYPTNIKTYPEKQNSMDVEFVVEKIYQSFLLKENKLILDGRPK